MRNILLTLILCLGYLLSSNAQSQFIVAGSYSPGDVYTDLIPDSVQIAMAVHLSPYPTYYFNIDLDSNGIEDVEITSGGNGGLGGGSGGSGIDPLQPNVELVAYYDTFQICCPTDVMRLVADSICLNDTISEQLTFVNDFAYFWSYGYGGASTPYIPVWRNIGVHFIGFRIFYSQDTLYGWIRVNTISPNPSEFYLHIMDFACNRNPSTGIIQPGTKSDVIIYPNPCVNELQLNSSSSFPVQLIVYSVDGKKVMDKTFIDKTTFAADFLPAGIYYYEMTDNKNEVRRGKLIKQNAKK